ncbi:PIK-related kinase, FAT [Heracleum sosnowskyi]|uniref:PIK-related kinase, FAT n=1 Tax=Heracleum sosnowskyi TaxID=360622 RepID=A0AAD8IAS1_9APIA|nr:PIK-related kinase, FAT [Heracleum sosnowskyi]
MGMATAKAKFSKPLLFRSKLLCFSVFYLFTSLFLALYVNLSSTKCILRSSPFDPIQSPLFTYPSSYGQHRHALPTLHSSCNSPVFFSDYWMVLQEIQEFSKNSTELGSEAVKYLKENADSFGGNFSAKKRYSYFDHENKDVNLPCGFLKKFPVSFSDWIAMRACDGVVVVSAIFNDHDKIRQPRGLGSKTLNNVCFFMFIDEVTLNGLYYHKMVSRLRKQHKIGAWRIVQVSTEHLYENAAMNGVIPKYLVHRIFTNSKFSIWVDAKMQLVVDPLLLIHTLIIKADADVAMSRHPFFVHTMEEAMATARWKKWGNINGLRMQMESYCENGLEPWSSKKLPYPSDVPDSALILRRHGVASNRFSCLLFNELEAFNPRDQLPFAFVRDFMKPKLKLNMFDVEVFEQVASEYRHNLNNVKVSGDRSRDKINTNTAFSNLFSGNASFNKCQGYLLKMWGELHD